MIPITHLAYPSMKHSRSGSEVSGCERSYASGHSLMCHTGRQAKGQVKVGWSSGDGDKQLSNYPQCLYKCTPLFKYLECLYMHLNSFTSVDCDGKQACCPVVKFTIKFDIFQVLLMCAKVSYFFHVAMVGRTRTVFFTPSCHSKQIQVLQMYRYYGDDNMAVM